ncbi:MAG: radical SAM/SPASM domain-containing protein [Bacteroidota bacterium]
MYNFSQLYTSYHYARLSKKPAHWGMPAKIGFEPTTSCNLRCPMCPSGLRDFSRPTGMAKTALLQDVVDQLHKDLVYLLLYFQGEPYLNPGFLEMANYAVSRGVFTATSTNGHYLTEEKARATVESGISEVLISIDGSTQETYQAYRVGGKLERVKEGIRNLVNWREKLRSLSPNIVIQFLVVRPNEHQLADMQALTKELKVDQLAVKTAQIYEYEKGHELIPTLDQYSRYAKQADGTYKIKNKLLNQCWKLWQGAEITWDGKVLPCCFDKDAAHEMGSLETQSFQDIWRSNAYGAFRQKLLFSRQEIEMCQNCTEGTQVWG